MNPQELQQLIKWVNLQIVRLTDSIKEAHQTNNYGRELQYTGMRDAFQKFLNKFNSSQDEKVKPGNKPSRKII